MPPAATPMQTSSSRSARWGPALRQIDKAKRICQACPAKAACLAWAIDHGITSGVWGGTAEDERRALRRPAEKK